MQINNINGYKIVNKLNSGASSVDKYIVIKNNKFYLLRLYDIRFISDRYRAFEYVNKIYNHNISVPKIYEFGEFLDKEHGYAIIDWINGISLDKLLNNNESINKYGKIVAKELIKLHSVNVLNEINIYQKFINTFNKKLEKIKNLGINYDFKLIEGFVLDNLEVLKNKEANIIHGDFHPGNIVVKDDKIHFIDLDVCKIDFAWNDLSSNACNLDFPRFYTALINEYFNNDIPNEFWIIYNLYGVLYCLDYILYCERIHNKTIDEGIKVLNKFLENSEEFSLLKPKWFDEKVLRKEK